MRRRTCVVRHGPERIEGAWEILVDDYIALAWTRIYFPLRLRRRQCKQKQ
jgi:hypothetical protein